MPIDLSDFPDFDEEPEKKKSPVSSLVSAKPKPPVAAAPSMRPAPKVVSRTVTPTRPVSPAMTRDFQSALMGGVTPVLPTGLPSVVHSPSLPPQLTLKPPSIPPAEKFYSLPPDDLLPGSRMYKAPPAPEPTGTYQQRQQEAIAYEQRQQRVARSPGEMLQRLNDMNTGAPPAPEAPTEWMDKFRNAMMSGLHLGNVSEAVRKGDVQGIINQTRMAAMYPKGKAAQEFVQAGMDVGKIWAAMKQDPIGVAGDMVINSMAMQASALPEQIAGARIGAAFGPLGQAVGLAAASGKTSFDLEKSFATLDYLQRNGVNTSDVESLRKAFQNEDLMGKAKSFANKRASAVAGVDAALAFGAGRMFPGLKPSAQFTANLGVQAVGGGAGEIAGQLASEGKVTDLAAAAAEMVGELGGAAPEVILGGMGQRRPQSPIAIPPRPAEPPAGIPPAPPIEAHGERTPRYEAPAIRRTEETPAVGMPVPVTMKPRGKVEPLPLVVKVKQIDNSLPKDITELDNMYATAQKNIDSYTDMLENKYGGDDAHAAADHIWKHDGNFSDIPYRETRVSDSEIDILRNLYRIRENINNHRDALTHSMVVDSLPKGLLTKEKISDIVREIQNTVNLDITMGRTDGDVSELFNDIYGRVSSVARSENEYVDIFTDRELAFEVANSWPNNEFGKNPIDIIRQAADITKAIAGGLPEYVDTLLRDPRYANKTEQRVTEERRALPAPAQVPVPAPVRPVEAQVAVEQGNAPVAGEAPAAGRRVTHKSGWTGTVVDERPGTPTIRVTNDRTGETNVLPERMFTTVEEKRNVVTPLDSDYPKLEWESPFGTRRVVGRVATPNGDRLEIATGEKAKGWNANELVRPEEIEQVMRFDEESFRQRRLSDEKVEIERREQQERRDERNYIDGFADNLSSIQRARILSTLQRVMRINGVEKSRRDHVRELVNNGHTVQYSFNGTRRLVGKNGGYLTENDLSKTAIDYAEYLINKRTTVEEPAAAIPADRIADASKTIEPEERVNPFQEDIDRVDSLTGLVEDAIRRIDEDIAASGIDFSSPPLKKSEVNEGEILYDQMGRVWTVGKGKMMIPSFSQSGVQGVQNEFIEGKPYPFKDAVQRNWGWDFDVAAWRRGAKPAPVTPEAVAADQISDSGKMVGEAKVDIDLSPTITAAHKKVSGWTKPNYTNANKTLDSLEKVGIDVEVSREKLEEYNELDRGEFDNAADYSAERRSSWNEFVESFNDMKDAYAEQRTEELSLTPAKPAPVTPEAVAADQVSESGKMVGEAKVITVSPTEAVRKHSKSPIYMDIAFAMERGRDPVSAYRSYFSERGELYGGDKRSEAHAKSIVQEIQNWQRESSTEVSPANTGEAITPAKIILRDTDLYDADSINERITSVRRQIAEREQIIPRNGQADFDKHNAKIVALNQRLDALHARLRAVNNGTLVRPEPKAKAVKPSFNERSAQREQERIIGYADRNSKSFVDDNFGEFNTYNKDAIAKFLDGETASIETSIGGQNWINALTRLGFDVSNTKSTVVDVVNFIKEKYQSQSSPLRDVAGESQAGREEGERVAPAAARLQEAQQVPGQPTVDAGEAGKKATLPSQMHETLRNAGSALDVASANATQDIMNLLSGKGPLAGEIVPGGQLGAALIKKGAIEIARLSLKAADAAVSFAEWSAVMTKEFGERITPFLDDLWGKAQTYAKEELPKLLPGAAEESRTTSTKNAVVDAERESRGAEPILAAARKTNESVWNSAMERIQKNPAVVATLIDELNTKPRAITASEEAILLHEKVTLQNELAKQYEILTNDNSSQDAIAEATVTVEKLWNANERIDQATRSAGTEWGRSGQFRQRLANENYELVPMLARLRAAKGGEPLTESETARVRELQRTIEENNRKADQKLAERDKRIAELEADAAIDRMKVDAKGKRQKSTESPVVIGERLVNKAKNTGKFRDTDLQEYALQLIRDGVTNREELIDRIHEKMMEADPNITRREAMDALSGYGKYTPLSTEAEKVILRDLKGQMQQLAKLDDMIEKGQLPAKTGVERRVPTADERILMREVNRIKKELGLERTSDAQLKSAMDAMKTRLRNRIEELRIAIKRGEKLPAKGRITVDDSETATLRIEKDALQAEYDTLFGEPKLSPEEKAMKVYKARLERKIAEYNNRILTGDFDKRVRKEQPTSPEIVALKAKAEIARKQFNALRARSEYERKSRTEKVGLGVVEGVNALRALLTSFDVSAVFRQGGIIALSNPMLAAKSLGPMLRALKSEDNVQRVLSEIKGRDNAPLYEKAKLFISDREEYHLSGMEEAFMSKLARHIPGVAASERAYITFLNKLRADAFDMLLNNLPSKGKNATQAELEAIANYVNIATGRGDLGRHAAAGNTLATVLFAPRLVTSRFQMIAGQPLYRGSAATRLLITKEYGKYAAGVSLVMALGLLAGGTIEKDPRSSDFLKIKFGDTRVDVLSGLGQVATLVARLLTGKTKTLSGEVVPLRGDDAKYGAGDAFDVAGRFVRTKFSPIMSTITNILSGKNVVGEKTTVKSVIGDMFTPLAVRDIYDIMKGQGIARGTILTALTLLGMGVQDFAPREKKPKDNKKSSGPIYRP